MEEADRNSASGPGNKTLYLGNLHPFISEAMLHDVFAGCRGVLELKIIKDKATGIPAGYGFAKFVDAISAQEGLDLVGKPVLFGQEVRINWAFQKEQREELGNHVHVFVGDLAADVTDAMLAAAFEVYPGCSDARVMWDHASGRSRGYGFVSFATKAQAEAAIQGQHGQTIGSRRVRCGWAQHKVGESAAPVDAAVLDRSDPTNTNVYVGNLDVALTDSEIRRHFSSFGALAEMKLHRKGAYGFVRFRSHADAVRAIVGSNAQPLGSKVLKCSWGRHPSLPPSGLHSHLLLATGAGLNPMLPLALSAPAPGMVSGGLGSGLVNPMLPALPSAMNHSLLPPYQPPVDAEAFLWKDLEHLFDDQGIDSSRYEEAVNFSDPISKFSSLRGYLANISFLRIALSPKFHLHDIRRTGPLELTTRWTMDMELSFNRFNPLKPWYDPKPVFTGTSIMTVNPDTGKFVSHIDTWDAVSNQSYLSLEAVRHLASQVLTLRQTPQDLTTPSYLVLKKMPRYEIRQYEGFTGLETRAGEAQGQAFQKLAGYLGGKNSRGRKLAMTTPVLTDDKGGMQFVVGADEAGEDGRDLPQASDESIRVTGSPPQIQGVATFSGAANQTLAAAKAAELRNILREDGHTPADATSWQLAQYNSPLVPGFLRRNEVLISLSDYKLW
ncbi:Nucleolysin TIAR [Auxenochlorella protothecoides]|uniref:Nucleolysin TIAR n=1 Tax=Auxenochlorella protothecoides TaxID=3075 RepID=A0A087SPZ7_AUXPR|nr:Nucleolysin TIAR [Auxenochlorella protothecoides]KFM27801.1 Nucleolysin TIAR [Auxenochlorella protothecoides]